MAVVTQGVTPARSYSPFEGVPERVRMVTAVPRGLVRFHASEALDAKPINDIINLTVTCSLPPAFAYVLSSLSFEIAVNKATDWNDTCRVRLFNGVPSAPVGNNLAAAFNMSNYDDGAVTDGRRILDYSLGDVRTWWPNPIVKTHGAAGLSVILQYTDDVATAAAGGTLEFNLALYQYELNQAVRFPLNFPLPVGIR